MLLTRSVLPSKAEPVPRTYGRPAESRNNGERIANVCFGLNVWAWGVLTIWAAPEAEQFHLVRICIASLHMVVGLLFLLRRPLVRAGQIRSLLAAMPALLCSGFAFAHAGPCQQWNNVAIGLFFVGTIVAIAAFASLARNFAVLPAVRGVTTGLYRMVRHPAYAGETLLVVACFAARPDLMAGLILIIAIAAVVIRIQAEERLLAGNILAYDRYRSKVSKRLIPGIW